MTETLVRKKPGMASVRDMLLLQDGPPPGGFAPVRYACRIPNSGPSATAIFLTAFGAFAWGMYQVGKGNAIRQLVASSPSNFLTVFVFILLIGNVYIVWLTDADLEVLLYLRF